MTKEVKPFPLATKDMLLRERRGETLQDAELMELISYYELLQNLSRRSPDYTLMSRDATSRLVKLNEYARARKLVREED